MGKIVDACGMTCPAPILLVKDTLEQTNPQELMVLVDNPASFENVNRFLTSKGYSVTDSQDGEVYRLEARYSQENPDLRADNPTETLEEQSGQKILILVTTDCLGSGDDELGAKLMTAYLKTIKEIGPDLWQLI
ncbi:MAG: sulfurtransferase TusA family protein, partial [Desulforhopalus sp.]